MAYDPVHVFKIVRTILDQCAYSAAALRVWSVLQQHGGPGDTVSFGRDELANFATVSVGTVSRVIAELEAAGVLDRIAQGNAGGRSRGRGPITVRMKRFW
jgi:DNA-binding MarR family transcriptional regulator